MRNRILYFLIIMCLSTAVSAQSVLVYTKNGEGYVHDNIENCVAMFMKIGEEHGYKVVHSDDPAVMTDSKLKKFDVIVFANSNNEGFDTDDQRLAFQHYILSGGGFMGVHSASGSERQWPWFWSVLGGKFRRHPAYQEFEMKVFNTAHPAASHLGDTWTWTDECYFLDHLNPENRILLAARLSTIEDKGKEEYPGSTFGDYMPVAWSKESYGGRQFYTALGHSKEFYSDPEFVSHILGGLQWVLADNKKKQSKKLPNQLIRESNE